MKLFTASGVHIDLTNSASIAAALAQIGPVDAVVSAAGNVAFGALLELTPEQWAVGLNDKLMGQVNLALLVTLELPRGIRINAVSPNVLQESMTGYAPYFRGFEAVPAARAALGFSRSVEGAQTGQIYKVF